MRHDAATRHGEAGFFYAPTVVTGVRQDDRIVQEEVFGPFVTVLTFKDDEEVKLQTSKIGLQLPSRADVKIRGVIVGEVLEFASTQPPREARAFIGEIAHILNALLAALQQRQSAYAAIPNALLELAGEKPQPVQIAPDEPLDADWEEPVVFDGCSTKGQARPEQPLRLAIDRLP